MACAENRPEMGIGPAAISSFTAIPPLKLTSMVADIPLIPAVGDWSSESSDQISETYT
jgi:hypothetical protein